MVTIGNRIFTKFERPDPKVVEMFRGLPSSNINDEMNRLFCMHDYIRLMNPACSRPLLGTAITVKAPIGDNLFFHQALDMAQPGDIIVVDGASGCNRSLAGEIMLRFATKKGLAGVVVDGCLRDLDGIEKLDMPIYAKGITPQGPFKFGPARSTPPLPAAARSFSREIFWWAIPTASLSSAVRTPRWSRRPQSKRRLPRIRPLN